LAPPFTSTFASTFVLPPIFIPALVLPFASFFSEESRLEDELDPFLGAVFVSVFPFTSVFESVFPFTSTFALTSVFPLASPFWESEVDSLDELDTFLGAPLVSVLPPTLHQSLNQFFPLLQLFP